MIVFGRLQFAFIAFCIYPVENDNSTSNIISTISQKHVNFPQLILSGEFIKMFDLFSQSV